MSDVMIRVENLGKKYMIGHQAEGRSNYVALRDVLADGAKSLVKRFTGRDKGDRRPTQEEFWALKDVSFEVKRGECVGIIGRNGAGKSTLLKILSRITEPTTGRVELHGRVASLLEVGTGFHPELTGRENIYLNGAILGMTRREIKAKFDEIVDFAEVEKFLDTPVKRYSSGMYVRLAFAVAAHLEPEILVVDEVLAVGDAAFQKKCLGKMGDVAEKEGRTVLFVSHNMGIISELCHKGLWFTNGKIYGKGETRNLIAKYLSHGVNQSGSILIKEDTDNHQFYFRRLCLIDNKDQISSTFSCQDSIKIKLEYEILKEIQDLEIGFRIVNFSGVNIFTVERSSYLKTALLTGSYMAEIEIPSFFLIPGKYTINIGSYVRNVGFLSFYESLLSFEIEETGSKMALYKGLDFGVVFADLPWKESRLSKS